MEGSRQRKPLLFTKELQAELVWISALPWAFSLNPFWNAYVVLADILSLHQPTVLCVQGKGSLPWSKNETQCATSWTIRSEEPRTVTSEAGPDFEIPAVWGVWLVVKERAQIVAAERLRQIACWRCWWQSPAPLRDGRESNSLLEDGYACDL